ncbi:MAG: hypothetical protein R2860_09960 [Desulfobacterales bacterium]
MHHGGDPPLALYVAHPHSTKDSKAPAANAPDRSREYAIRQVFDCLYPLSAAMIRGKYVEYFASRRIRIHNFHLTRLGFGKHQKSHSPGPRAIGFP